MTFEEFKSNVEAWAEARGIYEHSTALAQALKAVSEAGELADAVIKGDREALKDAIGDVTVCLVNVARMTGVPATVVDFDFEGTPYKGSNRVAALIAYQVDEIATYLAFWAESVRSIHSFDGLNHLAKLNGLTFEECCEAAWNEIKDRKGFLSPNGAFVKEGEA